MNRSISFNRLNCPDQACLLLCSRRLRPEKRFSHNGKKLAIRMAKVDIRLRSENKTSPAIVGVNAGLNFMDGFLLRVDLHSLEGE